MGQRAAYDRRWGPSADFRQRYPAVPRVDGVTLPKYFLSATWSTGGISTPGGSANAPDQVDLWTSQGNPDKPDVWSSIDHTINVLNTNLLAKDALERQLAAAKKGGGRRRHLSPRRRDGSRVVVEKPAQAADDDIISLADSAGDGSPAGADVSPNRVCASGRPWRQKGLNQAGDQKNKRRRERAALAASAKRRAQGRSSPSPPPIATHPNTRRRVEQTRRRSPTRERDSGAAMPERRASRSPKRSPKRDNRSQGRAS